METSIVAVCQQPNYFPWLGYFEQCARADVLVFLDNVQWIKQGRQHRTRILSHIGSAERFQWLSLPVQSQGHRNKTIDTMLIDQNQTWATKHFKSIQMTYGKRPFYKTQLEPVLKPWFEKMSAEKSVCTVAVESLMLCFELLDLNPKIVFSSTLQNSGVKTERLVGLCKQVGATAYYSGLGSTVYIDRNLFHAASIELHFQHWKHSDYEQGRNGFVSHLSILDALANVDVQTIRSWLFHYKKLLQYETIPK